MISNYIIITPIHSFPVLCGQNGVVNMFGPNRVDNDAMYYITSFFLYYYLFFNYLIYIIIVVIN